MKLSLVALFSLLAFRAQACPVINGEFDKAIDSRVYDSIVIATKVENGAYSYRISLDGMGPWILADGVERKVTDGDQTASVKLSCDGDTLVYSAEAPGTAPFRAQYTPVGQNQLKAHSDNPEDTDFNGIYTRAMPAL